MKILFLVLTLIPLVSLAELSHPLAIGESITLKTSALQTLRVQKKGIIRLQDEGSQLIITGQKIGKTRIQLGSKTHLIEVLKKKRFLTLNQLNTWAQNKRGPKVIIEDGEIKLKGRLLRLSDFKTLSDFTKETADFSLETKLLPPMRQKIQTFLKSLLLENNLPAGQLSFTPKASLRIPSQQKKLLSRYKKTLAPYGIQVLLDQNELTQARVIKIQVYIAHIKKSFMRQWGVNWPAETTATILAGTELNFQPLTLSLKALESQGQGQLLATPTLVTESNKVAEFHSGGEFPITTKNQFNNSVQWKPYGLFLKTKPVANAQGHLKVHIDLELSTLDHSFNANNVPALIRSHVKTQVNMEKPQPILLSGFLRQDQANSRSGLPWLQQIPIFKPLFATGNIHNHELELVFILIPSFHEPKS